jgi:paraquat-inducible protein B
MNATLEQLVRQGLRAQLTQDPPVIGGAQITLETVPDAPAGALITGGPYPEIPVKEGGGLAGLLAQAGRVPLGEIAQNVRAITAQLKNFTSSPQLKDSLAHLDASLVELDRTVHQAGPQIAPTLQSVHQTVDSLHQTAGEIDATAAAARLTLAGSPASANGNLQDSLRELTEAARAIRTLANDIDQQPESLVRGR